MFLDLLFGSPAVAVAWLAAIIVALTVHEFSHALVGKLSGDKTAEREGRLTLNPIAHLDPMGFFLILLFGFGWAKPVPYNPYNLKDQKWDAVKIGLAGPVSNIALAVVAGVALRVIGMDMTVLTAFLFLSIILNLFLALFNIIPVHPLDGSKLFFALFDHPRHAQLRHLVATRGPQILIIAVLLSAFTPLNIFGFISGPAFTTCDALTGSSCFALLASIL